LAESSVVNVQQRCDSIAAAIRSADL